MLRCPGRLTLLIRASVAIAAVQLAVAGCAVMQPVRVLPRGEARWIASVGGPVLPSHMPSIVVPYATVGRMWGRSDNVTLSANAHLTPGFVRVAGADVGLARRLRGADGPLPELTGQAQLYGFLGDGGARVYPNLTGTASWALGTRTLLYGGGAATVRLNPPMRVVLSPSLGVQRDIRSRLVVQVEGRWMAANVNSNTGLFEGENSIAGHGGMALFLGFQVKR